MKAFIILIQCLFIIHCCLGKSNNSNSKTNDGDGAQDAVAGVVTGGELPADTSNPKFKEMAKESLDKYLKEIGSNRHHEIQVTRVTNQVVAGTLTRINFIAFATSCLLTTDMEPINPPCMITTPPNALSCYSKIWDRPWLNKKEVSVRCAPRT